MSEKVFYKNENLWFEKTKDFSAMMNCLNYIKKKHKYTIIGNVLSDIKVNNKNDYPIVELKQTFLQKFFKE